MMASQRWSATAVSIMNCEMMQLSSSKSQSYCAMYVKAVIVLIGPAHGLTFRSSSESPGSMANNVCKRCDHEEQEQHGDMGWTEPTITPPRGCSQLPLFYAFELEDERRCFQAVFFGMLPSASTYITRTVGAAAASERDRVVALQAEEWPKSKVYTPVLQLYREGRKQGCRSHPN